MGMPIKFIGKFDNQVSQGAKQAGKDLDNMGKKAEKSNKGFKTMLTTVGTVVGVLGALGIAAKKTFEFAREGAELARAETKFLRLADGIGATDDLLQQLQETTRGTRSEMELMASAGDFLALGLAKNQEELLRLTKVSGALGMDMNQLVLTLTNMTTMRFDALGVQVDGFKEKVKDLEATGLSAADAFKEAFLQQSEEQLKRVGDVADDTIGVYMRLEAVMEDYTASAKKQVAEGLKPQIKALTDELASITLVNEALEEGIVVRDAFGNVTIVATNETMKFADAQEWLLDVSRLSADEAYNSIRAYEDYENAIVVTDESVELLAGHTRELAEQTLKATNKINALGAALNDMPTTNAIISLLEEMERLAAGGDMLTGIEELAIELAALDGLDKAQELLRQTAAASVLLDRKLGDISSKEAQAQLEELGFTAEEAAAMLADVLGTLKRIDGFIARATVLVSTLAAGGDPATGPTGPGNPTGQQSGADFVVPPTATNDSQPVRVTAGERVRVDTASQTKANSLEALFASDEMAEKIGAAVANALLPVMAAV